MRKLEASQIQGHALDDKLQGCQSMDRLDGAHANPGKARQKRPILRGHARPGPCAPLQTRPWQPLLTS